MPYIILTANGEELDRRELTGPLTLGRSTECDVRIHDILMSRCHCRIDPDKNGRWKLIDLGSKNGSHFNWKRVTEHLLFDGDSVRVGRTYLQFHTGPFVPSTGRVKKGKLVRPADPHEALTGTIADFVLLESDGNDAEFDGAPSPRHRPAGPVDGIATAGSVLAELSSSWDSVVATVSKPRPRMRMMPQPLPVGAAPRAGTRKRLEPDLSLQAASRHLPYLEVMPQKLPRKRTRRWVPLVAVGVGISAATLVVLYSGWMMMNG